MSKYSSTRPSLKNIRRLQISMIVGYAVIIIAVISLVTTFTVNKTDDVLQSKVVSMSSSLNVQMKLNLDSYLSRMETIGTLAFGAEEAYKYDATDPDNDEFEAINTEKIISDKLYSLCIMDNFVDYGIVYRNNRTVGKISNGTAALFGDAIFEELSGIITRQRTKDGWAAGYKDNFKRIYYVKRVHDNAVLVLSFYTTELEEVFDNPETLSDMEIRLVNKDYDILYSSNKDDELGAHLTEDILSRVEGKSSASVMDDKYLVSVNSGDDGWYVICSIPTEIILQEKNEMRLYIYMAGIIAAILAVLLGTFLSIRLTIPVKKAVALLDTRANNDQLTGILNKQSFHERTAGTIDSSLGIDRRALILLDLDNFKGVNDTLGHAYGDKVLAKTGSILRAEFSTEDLVGRIGGDEFAVFVNSDPEDGVDYEDYIRSKCENLCKAFSVNYMGDDESYKISASIGVSLFPQDGKSFEELYKASDSALYRSKKKGKDTYTFYDKAEKTEVADK